MAEYHTVYKGPEGETTQWEDIQVKLGNWAPRAPKHKPPKWEAEREVEKNREYVKARDDEELEDLEDDFADDRELEKYRLQRLAELREAQQRPKQAGSLEMIRQSDFRRAVTDASQGAWVVVLLFKHDHEGCTVLAECFDRLAQQHPQSKFVKIISTDCIPDFPDSKLPTVLLYHDGKCQKTFAGLNVWGGKRASAEFAALVLNQEGPVCKHSAENEENSGQPDEQEMKQFVRRVVLQRQQEVEDEDSDFDDV